MTDEAHGGPRHPSARLPRKGAGYQMSGDRPTRGGGQLILGGLAVIGGLAVRLFSGVRMRIAASALQLCFVIEGSRRVVARCGKSPERGDTYCEAIRVVSMTAEYSGARRARTSNPANSI
eukprot:3201357-Pyramimonas_sp.AAC.1